VRTPRAPTSISWCARSRGGRVGATTINLPDTVGYAHSGDIAAMFQAVTRGVRDREGHAVHGTTTTTWARGRELHRRDRGGARPGRVHAERHRRARGQRVARRDRDGDSRCCPGTSTLRDHRRRRAALPGQRGARARHGDEAAAEQGDRGREQRSRTRRASTRTACSRIAAPTRS
jgi:hypothetical protein